MKKSKLMLSVFVTAIALSIAGLSMSLAWYSSSTLLLVDSINITIDCDRQLAISYKEDEGFVPKLDTKDLRDDFAFVPVTSAYSSSWLEKKSDMPVFFDDTNYSTKENAETTKVANTGYFSSKFYLKADDDVYVSINPEDTYIKSDSESNKALVEKLYKNYQASNVESLMNLSKQDIEDRLNRLAGAMRYSILVTDHDDYNYAIIDPNKDGETTYGGLLDNNADGYYDYYSKASDSEYYERVYGELIGEKENIVYDSALDKDSSYVDVNEEPNAFNARHKKGVRRFNLEASKAQGVEFKKEQSCSLEEFKQEVKPFHFPVYRDKPQEIVISVYIEGWDLDSINYTMGATFFANLSLKIEKEMLV